MNIYSRSQLYEKLLSLTIDGNSTTLSELEKETKITVEEFERILSELQSINLISRNGADIQLNLGQRLEIAVKLVEFGGDLTSISNRLGWLEFEEFSAQVFEKNGFNVRRRFRFQGEGRRWEIDVLACSYPFIICAECKHWTRGIGDGAARNIIEVHLEKTGVFSEKIHELAEKIKVDRWRKAIIIPVTLTLSPTRMKIYRRVPSVSVHALPSFLNEFSGYLERMVHFNVEIPEYKPKPRQIKLR